MKKPILLMGIGAVIIYMLYYFTSPYQRCVRMAPEYKDEVIQKRVCVKPVIKQTKDPKREACIKREKAKKDGNIYRCYFKKDKNNNNSQTGSLNDELRDRLNYQDCLEHNERKPRLAEDKLLSYKKGCTNKHSW